MPTMERRIKGCRNAHCRYNKERKHLPLDYNYCPICGEKAKRAEARKDKLENAGQQVKAKVVEPVLDEAMNAVKKAAVKKAVPAAGKAVKKVIKWP